MPLHSNTLRYLPHISSSEVLRMGLKQQPPGNWIETDSAIRHYFQHKLALRESRGSAVYRASPASLPAQEELASSLRDYLLREQPSNYKREGDALHCVPGGFRVPAQSADPLWNSSLWIADDLVLMQRIGGRYHLSAASLCSPSHWSLAEKFGRPIREIHDPVPGFHRQLSPRIDRFFDQLQAGQLFERFNWSLQLGDGLARFPGEEETADADSAVFYRVERQSLRRLPQTAAIVFSIRVYVHPLQDLLTARGALVSLLQTIAGMEAPMLRYKGIDRLAPALEKYRALAGLQCNEDTSEYPGSPKP